MKKDEVEVGQYAPRSPNTILIANIKQLGKGKGDDVLTAK